MSIAILFSENEYDLFCDSITAKILNSNTLNTPSIIANHVSTSILTLSGGSELSNYIEVNLNGQLSGPWASGPSCVLKLSKLNNRVTISQTDNLTAIQNSSTFISFPVALPLAYRPSNPAFVRIPLIVFDGGVGNYQLGMIRIDPATGLMTFYRDLNQLNFSGTSNCGILPFSVSYDISA